MKPVINLNDINEFPIDRAQGRFGAKYARVCEQLGAQKLGYGLCVVQPGMRMCPFHSHRVNEELFLILEGTGTLRFGSEEYPLRPMDLIGCPPGGPELAHQIINTGDGPMKYLVISTAADMDICEYPDSGKFLAMQGPPGERTFAHIGRAGDAVDYFDGEEP